MSVAIFLLACFKQSRAAGHVFLVKPIAVALVLVATMGSWSAKADDVDGTWSPVFDWPLITVHAAVTPDFRVLSYGTRGNGQQTGYFIYDVWDPSVGASATGHMTLNNMTLTDLFCSSQVILPQSGEIFIAGGDNWTGTGTNNQGNNNSNLFDYSDNTLVRSNNMFRARWYSSTTVMIDGEVYIQGGSGGEDRPEVRQLDGNFRLLSNTNTSSYGSSFPRNFVSPDGRVFGYDTNGKMFFVNHSGTGALSAAGQLPAANAGWPSSAAMFLPGKILQIGGNSNAAAIIDINGPQPTLTLTQSMSSRRQWVSATVMADGKVIGTGGSQNANELTGVNNSAEIWDPATGQWHVGPSAVQARLYHSAALLLPDASVLVSGGGAPGPQTNTNAEIYYPPYLFNGDELAVRPQILSAPDTAEVGDVLNIEMNTSAVAAVNLVKTGSVTHSVNMDQRFLTLPFTRSGSMLQATLPARATDTPPGYYLMFVLDNDGVPSMANMLRINIDATPFIAVDYTPTIGGAGGTAFKLACPSDEIIAGVHGRFATVVNQIGPKCVKIDQLGRWIGDPVNGPVTGTTSTGTSFSKTCPRDYAVSGFRGRSNTLVNQLDIQCRALTPFGGLTGAEQYLGADGGTGGNVQGPQACGTGNPVYALYGRSGTQLNNFGVQCRAAVITPISINSSPVIVNPGPQSGIVGIELSLQINASDGDVEDILTYSATNLPAGLSINADSGLISGTPTTANVYNASVTVTDGDEDDTANFTWTVVTAALLAVEPMPSQPAAPVDFPVTYNAVATGGVDVVYRWDFGDGTPETAYSPSSSVNHTFTEAGIYFVTLTVNDDFGAPNIQTFVQAVHLPLTANKPASSSNIAYETRAGNDRVWVVNQDNDSVTVIDAVTDAKLAEVSVGGAPRAVAVAPDGRIWVTNKGSATISIIDPVTLGIAQTVSMPQGSAPYGIVFSAAANDGYVVLEATGQLLKVDASTGGILLSASTGPNPRHVSINAAGTSVYVSRFVTPQQPGEETANVQSDIGGEPQGGELLVFASANLSLSDTIVLQHSNKADAENQGSGVPNYLGAAELSPDGTVAWVPSKMDNIKRGSLRNGLNINFQNTVRAIGSSIDLAAVSETYAKRIDFDDASIASAAAFDPLGIYLFVSLETSREIAVVDAHSSYEIFRINADRAPQGLVVSPDGEKLFVNNFMDRTVGIYDLGELKDTGLWTAPLMASVQAVEIENLSAEVLVGKQLFYDAFDTRLARDRYLSCATCHNDGGQDGRVWDLTGMGEGLRNTINLHGTGANHGKSHWSQNFDEIQDFEGQIRALAGGTGLMNNADFFQGTRSTPLGDPKAGISADLDALAAYVASLDNFAESPYRNVDGTLTAMAEIGRSVFITNNCTTCHAGSSFTDSSSSVLHDIGTLKASSGQRLGGPLSGIDTPTLKGVWATTPYLHDGSAATIKAAIAAHSPQSLGGAVLSQSELDALAAFVNSIDDRPIPGGTADVTPPSVPGNVDAIATGMHQIAVTWDASTDDLSGVAGYRVYRDGSLISDQVGTGLNDTNLMPDTNYEYTVAAYDAAIPVNVSAQSDPADATTDPEPVEVDITAPTIPTITTIVASSPNQVDLQWTASTDAESGLGGYYVYRDGNPTPIATLATESFSDTTVSPLISYSYRVAAFDNAVPSNVSAMSLAAAVTTPAAGTVESAQFSPGGGTYVGPVQVTVTTATSGASLYYTLDGSAPTQASAAYGGPIQVSTNATLRVRGYKDGLNPSAIVSATYTFQQIPVTGLVAYWSFNEGSGTTATDVTGLGHTGTVNGGAQWVTGQSGTALSFDGVNDQVTVPHMADLSYATGASFTVSAWVNVPVLPGKWTGVVAKSRNATPWYGIWITNTNRWNFGGPVNVTGNVVTTGWHHVAVVQTGGQRHLYVDGTLQATGAAQAGTGTGALVIGGAGGVSEFFNGQVDEVRIYSTGLSQAEVQVLATVVAGNTAPLANAGADQVLVDLNGNGSEAVLLNGSGSTDIGGSIANYRWRNGATVLAEGTSATASISLPVGVHTITLEVTDNEGASATDGVQITVQPQPVNTAPVVNAGGDLGITVGDQLSLSGASASDDGLPVSPGTVSLLWSVESGPAAVSWPLGDQNQLLAHAVFPAVGTYVLRLTASDGTLSAFDERSVTVTGDVALPQLSPGGGTYVGPVQVTVTTATSGASLYYTLDGSAPTQASAAYGGPIQVSTNATLRVRGYKDGLNPSAIVSATYTFQQIPVTGLVAYWSFNEGSGTTATDVTGLGHTGTVNGGAQWVTGQSGTALSFDGVNDQVTVPHMADLSYATGASFTVSAWVNVPVLPGKWTGVVAKSRNATPWYGIWITNTNRWNFGGPVNVTGNVVTTGWHHVAVVQTGGQRHLYVDGTLQATGAAQAGTGTGALVIGGAGGVSEFFNGQVDEVRIYSTGLSQAEVQVLATVVAGNTAPLANAGADQVLVDLNGNGSEAVLLNGSGSTDIGGSIANYRWRNGATVLAEGTSATASISLPVGVHTITLEVTDNEGASATDGVQITVQPQPVNTAPVVNAGGDLGITVGDQLSLSGASASDDGLPVSPGTVSLLWSVESGPAAVSWPLGDQNQLLAHAVFPAVGTYVLRLTASDGTLSAFDERSVTVTGDVALPQLSPGGGTYVGPVQVTVTTATSGASLYYTLDGSAPTQASAAYGGPIQVSTNATLRVRGYKDGLNPSAIVSATYTFQQIPVTGLVAYWSFNEGSGTTATDVTGLGHTGTVNGGAQWVTGQSGTALSFDGVNDQVTVPHMADLSYATGASFTVSAWVNVPVLPGKWTGVVAKSRNATPWYGIWITNTNRWNFGGPVNVTGNVVTTGWHHVAVVQTGGQRHLYVDGTLQATGAAQAGTGTGALVIGGAGGVSEFFNGQVDEVRIYSTGLSQAEVQVLATP